MRRDVRAAISDDQFDALCHVFAVAKNSVWQFRRLGIKSAARQEAALCRSFVAMWCERV